MNKFLTILLFFIAIVIGAVVFASKCFYSEAEFKVLQNKETNPVLEDNKSNSELGLVIDTTFEENALGQNSIDPLPVKNKEVSNKEVSTLDEPICLEDSIEVECIEDFITEDVEIVLEESSVDKEKTF